jgi:GTPase SAR1 family protein
MNSNSTEEIKDKCRKFRVLIIGRANAGKTTILQRVCDTIEDPEIYNKEGEKVGCDGDREI